MDIIEQLLGFDPSEIKQLSTTCKLNLKKLGGVEFEFPLTALTTEQACTIQDEAYKLLLNDGDTEVESRMYKTKVKTLILGCKDVFANPQIQKHFGVYSAEALISKLLTPGEIDTLKNEIDNLSGYDTNDVPDDQKAAERVKN